MKTQKLLKMAWAAILTLAVLALTGRLGTPASVQAQDNRHDKNNGAYRIERGFEIAPVPLNLEPPPSPLHNECGDDQAVSQDCASEVPHRTRRQ